jgi:hypothetical protein
MKNKEKEWNPSFGNFVETSQSYVEENLTTEDISELAAKMGFIYPIFKLIRMANGDIIKEPKAYPYQILRLYRLRNKGKQE